MGYQRNAIELRSYSAKKRGDDECEANPVLIPLSLDPDELARAYCLRKNLDPARLGDQAMRDIRGRLEKWSVQLKEAGKANTISAYRSDLRWFASWCERNARSVLPASEETLTAFLHAHDDRKVSSLRRCVSSIAKLHDVADLVSPVTGAVKESLAYIRRKQNKHDIEKVEASKEAEVKYRTRQAEGFRRAHLQAWEKAIGVPPADLGKGTPGSRSQVRRAAMAKLRLRDLRDGALLSTAYYTMLRASELRRVHLGHIAPAEDEDGMQDGYTVRVPFTKTNSEFEEFRWIPQETKDWIDAWVEAAEVSLGDKHAFTTGPALFRTLAKGDKVQDTIVSRQTIWNLLKRAAALIGADETLFSAHSTRVGHAQDQLAGNIELLAVMQAGGWKSPAMPQRYGARVGAVKGGTARLYKRRTQAALAGDDDESGAAQDESE